MAALASAWAPDPGENPSASSLYVPAPRRRRPELAATATTVRRHTARPGSRLLPTPGGVCAARAASPLHRTNRVDEPLTILCLSSVFLDNFIVCFPPADEAFKSLSENRLLLHVVSVPETEHKFLQPNFCTNFDVHRSHFVVCFFPKEANLSKAE